MWDFLRFVLEHDPSLFGGCLFAGIVVLVVICWAACSIVRSLCDTGCRVELRRRPEDDDEDEDEPDEYADEEPENEPERRDA